MELNYNGVALPSDMIDYLVKAAKSLNVPPSYLITKLHFEGIWGQSEVARANNNWSGMTWTGDPNRPSGIVVSKGSARPAREGGHYMRYKSVDEFLTDWTYLIRRGGIYKVADSATFDEAVKGMFKVGGAKYDYAASGFDHYSKGMKARRQAINRANNGALDKLDNAKESNKGVSKTMQGTAQAMISEARKMVGVSHGTTAYNNMVNDYNNNLQWAISNGGLNPKPRNVNLSPNPSSGAYDWCAGFVSVMAKRSGNIGTVGYEIAAERLGKQQHETRGSWLGRVRPKAGDLLLFRWTGAPGWADHIGLVESVVGNTINTIEGNVGSPRAVRRRSYAWDDYRITGYARPKYRVVSDEPKKSNTEIAQEVIAGKWGNGSDRINRLANAGYSSTEVQQEVNKILANPPENQKSNDEVAQEIIDGKWGNNPERSKKLIEAGYDVNAVQALVNEKLKQPSDSEIVEVVDEEPKDEEDITLERNEFEIDGRVYVVNLRE